MKVRLNTVKEKALALTEERGVFWLLAAVLIASFVLYSVFVQRTIRNVVERQHLETEMSVLNSRIGELEFKYISMRNNVTIDMAYAKGFKDVAQTKFVSKKALSQATVARIH